MQTSIYKESYWLTLHGVDDSPEHIKYLNFFNQEMQAASNVGFI